eukprot:TRINITY_DN14968_c0_g1_i2.p2 TRINITY_DN14968_c0_g1~~TRINITY_DN14968_c0_g1_i2.p2  ORF type:complete len:131 (+),score=26.39 TRINITY_DN14968_c0_g1_i2:55-393(+)
MPCGIGEAVIVMKLAGAKASGAVAATALPSPPPDPSLPHTFHGVQTGFECEDTLQEGLIDLAEGSPWIAALGGVSAASQGDEGQSEEFLADFKLYADMWQTELGLLAQESLA